MWNGLSAKEVEERIQSGKVNIMEDYVSKTVKQIVFENTFTYFNLIFVVLASFLLVLGRWKQSMFLIAAVINTVVGIIQQMRSKRVIDRLKLVAAAHYPVIRDGKEESVITNELVLDDLVRLKAGNQIPADAKVVDGEIYASEALITGESEPIRKLPGEELKSGSFVLSGACVCRLTAVGADAYISRLTKEAKSKKIGRKAEMMESLDKLLRVIGAILIPVGIILFLKQRMLMGLSFEDSVVSAVAALVGMIPEGLYLLITAALTLSVMRLALKQVVVNEMNSIETLARVDVFCVDKTGTITEPEMKVDRFVMVEKNGAGSAAGAEVGAGRPERASRRISGDDRETCSRQELFRVLSACYHGHEPDNETAAAMGRFFDDPKDLSLREEIPFRSQTKWSAFLLGDGSSWLVGAPNMLLSETQKAVRSQAFAFEQEGKRVLLAAKASTFPDREKGIEEELDPVGWILLDNPIRESAPEIFRYFAQQGVEIKVISGDNPTTVSRIAERAGIQHADRFLDARSLKEQADFEKAAEEITVFGRVTPEQKRSLIAALQKHGHTVAMTGDGVNDVLALKDSDCGIAMASGSEAACQAANLVLLDSDFARMPAVVSEGRRVINNIERSSSLYLVKNIMSFLLAILLLAIPLSYPLMPVALTMISSCTIGIPSFLLALEPNEDRVEGKFMRKVLFHALPGGFTNVCVLMAAAIICKIEGFSTQEMYTMAGYIAGFAGVVVLGDVCRSRNWKRIAIWAGSSLLLLVNILLFDRVLYEMTILAWDRKMITLIIMIVTIPLYIFWKFIVRKTAEILAEWREKYNPGQS